MKLFFHNCFGYILHTEALSATDSDNDYNCVSYTVTMVDVRSCTRPPRFPCWTLHTSHTGTVCITLKILTYVAIAIHTIINDSLLLWN